MPRSGRDLDDVRRALTGWLATRHDGVRLVDLQRAAGGRTNETFLLDASWTGGGASLVVRVEPAGEGLFARYDLAMQAAVQELAAAHGVPTAVPAEVVDDRTWLGAPFLVMPWVRGRVPGSIPSLDAWLAEAAPDRQRALYTSFLDALVAIHRIPLQAPTVPVRRAGIDEELDWWEELLRWSADGVPAPPLVEAIAWCRAHRPADEPPPSVLWGDVRLGNVVVDDDFGVRAVLDWELASIGPAEMDLGWCLGLEAVAEQVVGGRLPGFLARDEVLERHAAALGRPLVAYEWFETFALVRALIVDERDNRLAAAAGRRAIPLDRHPVLAAIRARTT